MKVVLTTQVPGLGEAGDVREVKPGYGRNYLVPSGMAVIASPGALKRVDELRRAEARRLERMRGDMTRLAERLASLELRMTARVGEMGRLYGTITASDIADQIQAKMGEPIDRRKVALHEPIRSLGPHDVSVRLMPGVEATIRVIVEGEEERQPVKVEAEGGTAVQADEVSGQPALDAEEGSTQPSVEAEESPGAAERSAAEPQA
jgi:large subunit ribosomal protein L9